VVENLLKRIGTLLADGAPEDLSEIRSDAFEHARNRSVFLRAIPPLEHFKVAAVSRSREVAATDVKARTCRSGEENELGMEGATRQLHSLNDIVSPRPLEKCKLAVQ
jgi:hypothetical protein